MTHFTSLMAAAKMFFPLFFVGTIEQQVGLLLFFCLAKNPLARITETLNWKVQKYNVRICIIRNILGKKCQNWPIRAFLLRNKSRIMINWFFDLKNTSKCSSRLNLHFFKSPLCLLNYWLISISNYSYNFIPFFLHLY